MLLKNSVQNPLVIPEFFHNVLDIHFTCVLTEEEKAIFIDSLSAMEKQLRRDNIRLTTALVLFIASNEYTIQYEETDRRIIGQQPSLIIYRINRCREKELNYKWMITVYLEELCHLFYKTQDEFITKQKVRETVKNYIPSIDPATLYTIEIILERRKN